MHNKSTLYKRRFPWKIILSTSRTTAFHRCLRSLNTVTNFQSTRDVTICTQGIPLHDLSRQRKTISCCAENFLPLIMTSISRHNVFPWRINTMLSYTVLPVTNFISNHFGFWFWNASSKKWHVLNTRIFLSAAVENESVGVIVIPSVASLLFWF